HPVIKEYGDYDSGYCDAESHPPECRFPGAAENDRHECSEMAAYEERADECQAGQSVLPENIFRSFAFSAFAFPCFFTDVRIPFAYPVHVDDQYKKCKESTCNSDDISHEEIHANHDADRNDDERFKKRYSR